MIRYKVTTELKTVWWLKVLRFFRIKNKREEFELCFQHVGYEEGDILTTTNNSKIKILGYGNNL